MASKFTGEPTGLRRRLLRAALGVLSATLVVVVLLGLRPQPQMGADEDVFNTVDALFTAVTARDPKRLGDCEKRLRQYREAGKLPEAAAKVLDGVIGTARSGEWRPAAERLYTFMEAQRREEGGGRAGKQSAAK